MSESEFWQAAYLAALASGKNSTDARTAAELAVDHLRERDSE